MHCSGVDNFSCVDKAAVGDFTADLSVLILDDKHPDKLRSETSITIKIYNLGVLNFIINLAKCVVLQVFFSDDADELVSGLLHVVYVDVELSVFGRNHTPVV